MRVGLVVTCLVDLVRPEIGFAAVALLEQVGCKVEVPESQTCCGQPAYGSGDAATARAGRVYPGPMGSVLTPSSVGLENALDLPHAATLCGRCQVVCPVKIPLPDLLRKLREKQFERGRRPWHERVALTAWGYAALRPSPYRAASRIAARVLAWLGGERRRIRTLPFATGWTDHRDFPAPSGKTFHEPSRETRSRR